MYIFIRILGENDFFFPSLNIFDAFELDVNVVNFVYCGKTRMFNDRYLFLSFSMEVCLIISSQRKEKLSDDSRRWLS